MRQILIAIFTTLLTFTLSSQDLHLNEIAEETIEFQESKWKIGPRIGIGVNLTQPESVLIYLAEDGIAYDIAFLNSSSSKSIGLTFEKTFEYAFIQFGLLHTSLSSNFDVTGYGEKEKTARIFNESYRNIELPVLAGGKFGKFRLGFGPIVKYNLATITEFTDLVGYETKDSKINLGSQAAFGVDLGIFSMDVRYIHDFEAIGDNMTFGGDHENSFKNRPSEIKLTIGTSF